jgi:hypothetical protein
MILNLREIDKAVAAEFGWRWVCSDFAESLLDEPRVVTTYLAPGYRVTGTTKVTVLDHEPTAHDEDFGLLPPYSSDPLAAKLVKQRVALVNHQYSSGYDANYAYREGGPHWAKIDRCNHMAYGDFYVRCDGEETALALAFLLSQKFAKCGQERCGWVDLRWCKRCDAPSGDFAWLLQIYDDEPIQRDRIFNRWSFDVLTLITEGVDFLATYQGHEKEQSNGK